MAGRLEGKVAIITGGTSGIGRGTVDLFLKEGAKVVAADLQDHKGEAMERELGKNFSYCRTNVSQEAEVKNLVEHTIAKFGKLDVMFNNAGYGGVGGELQEIDMNGFDETVGVLLKGVVLGYKYAVPHMKAQNSGSIISTASVAGLQAGFGPLVYSACKAAVHHFSRCAAMELAPYFVRSNAICPGGIATSIFGAGLGLGTQVADQFAEYMKPHLAKIQPTPRAGVPNDIAETALFLASDASSFVTGQAIAVDGGLTAGQMASLGKRIDFEKVIGDFMAALPADQKPA
ncbi:MAG TPA: glucose 1-dehydrogenase [Parvibaculum sp.]|uniref:SDR family NAD(P)-dependent oxidoreductase n=1 Tax=Parvibaculum sp. TaxID=2024848 RepID=UPI002C2E62FD|nr:glucose 1-dehydrogenase [Parvibaculum sp.]HMM14283.1 glucose 1-dehydrogenase [Parvibaculum sp.]